MNLYPVDLPNPALRRLEPPGHYIYKWWPYQRQAAGMYQKKPQYAAVRYPPPLATVACPSNFKKASFVTAKIYHISKICIMNLRETIVDYLDDVTWWSSHPRGYQRREALQFSVPRSSFQTLLVAIHQPRPCPSDSKFWIDWPRLLSSALHNMHDNWDRQAYKTSRSPNSSYLERVCRNWHLFSISSTSHRTTFLCFESETLVQGPIPDDLSTSSNPKHIFK